MVAALTPLLLGDVAQDLFHMHTASSKAGSLTFRARYSSAHFRNSYLIFSDASSNRMFEGEKSYIIFNWLISFIEGHSSEEVPHKDDPRDHLGQSW